MTWDQISGPLDRVILVALTFLAARGYISTSEVAGYATLALGVLGAFYGWWVNRPKAILQSAAALPNVTQVVTTDKSMADSITSEKVVSK